MLPLPPPTTSAYARLSNGVFRLARVPAVTPRRGSDATSPATTAPSVPAPTVAAQVGVLDGVQAELQDQARSWGRRIRLLQTWRALPSPGERFDQLELAGSWHISQTTATRWLDEAARLTSCLPATLAGLEAGTLLVHQAQVLLHRTRHCTPEVARAVDAEVAPGAAALCPSDLGRRVDRAVLRIESELAGSEAAEQRHADAAADRRTFTRSEPDGMGLAGALLTAEQLVAWQLDLDQLERAERIADREAGVERTADQRRADLFAALPAMVLAGTGLSERRAQGPPVVDDAPRPPWTYGPEQLAATVVLNVHVPMATVLDLSRAPGTLERYGPVSAEHVRLLRPTLLRRVLVDSTSGRPIAVDDRARPLSGDPATARQQLLDLLEPVVVTDAEEPQHDPSARLARLVDLRDVRCCGPGCSSGRTDRDHLEPHPDGPTCADNLGRLSTRCHRAKHHGWTLTRHLDGSTTWLSPLGRRYTRPSPHDPPPDVGDDIDAEGEGRGLPPLRPPPVGRPQTDGRPEDDVSAPQLLRPAEPARTDASQDDEPPF